MKNFRELFKTKTAKLAYDKWPCNIRIQPCDTEEVLEEYRNTGHILFEIEIFPYDFLEECMRVPFIFNLIKGFGEYIQEIVNPILENQLLYQYMDSDDNCIRQKIYEATDAVNEALEIESHTGIFLTNLEMLYINLYALIAFEAYMTEYEVDERTTTIYSFIKDDTREPVYINFARKDD